MTALATLPAVTPKVFTIGQAATVVHNLGWQADTDAQVVKAVGLFQAGFNLHVEAGIPPLTIDEVVGPQTTVALAYAERRRKASQPTASAHFSFDEFACQCHGTCAGCLRIRVARPLLVGLEKLRAAKAPSGLRVLSGYRCPLHNAATVHAASGSQHQWGGGCDVIQLWSKEEVAALGVFSGIGTHGSLSGHVQHVDVRGEACGTGNKAAVYRPPATTGGTPAHPTFFVEAA